MTRPDPDMTPLGDLDALLAEAADSAPPAPNPQFMTQMMQDALALQPLPHREEPGTSLWHQVQNVLGGWQGMGGLVAATFAGVWIGINPPQSVPESVEALLNMEFVYAISDAGTDIGTDALGFGWVMDEG